MIQVNNVVKTFDGFRALDGLTMSVEGGSIYGLVGPNGAGKSTILRHIMGVYRPDSGSILVDGQPVYENPAVKGRMAWIPDDLYYFLSASTRDMMRFAGRLPRRGRGAAHPEAVQGHAEAVRLLAVPVLHAGHHGAG